MIYGEAWKPFVYRVFVPAATKLIIGIIPQKFENGLTEFGNENGSAVRVLSELNWESEYLTEYLATSLIMFLSLLGFSLMLKKFFKINFDSPEWFANLIVIVGLLGLPAMFKYDNYIYDFPTLFFFTAGLITLQRQNWKWFLVIFFFACWNKETTILLTMIFVICHWNKFFSEKKKFYSLLAVQIGIFLIIKIILTLTFAENPGSLVEFHLFDYNVIMFNGYNLLVFTSLLFLFLLVANNWNEKPEFLKKSLWIIIPLTVLTLFLGYFDELRDFYEVYPVIVLLIAYSIAKIIGLEIRVKTAQSG